MANLAVEQPFVRPDTSPRCRFDLYSPTSPERAQVSAYIAEKYQEVHRAHLNDFLPILIQLTRDQVPLAAFGLQPGHYRPLFLEQYFDQPIEQHVARVAGKPIDRCGLIEVGNLAITNRMYGPLLLVTLASSLSMAGYEWMVFTATKQVSKLVRGMGFDPYYLVAADPERLAGAKTNWGTYYNNNPGVMIGNVGKAIELIAHNNRLKAMASEYKDTIHQIAHCLSDYRRLSQG